MKLGLVLVCTKIGHAPTFEIRESWYVLVTPVTKLEIVTFTSKIVELINAELMTMFLLKLENI